MPCQAAPDYAWLQAAKPDGDQKSVLLLGLPTATDHTKEQAKARVSTRPATTPKRAGGKSTRRHHKTSKALYNPNFSRAKRTTTLANARLQSNHSSKQQSL